jgi:deoxyribonuclease-4
VSRSAVELPRIGLQTGIVGGIFRSVASAALKGCQTWQIFSHNPRGWAVRPLEQDSIAKFQDLRQQHGLSPCIIHAAYLVNLASSSEEIRSKSITAFRDEIERGLTIGADYLAVHPGSAKGTTVEHAIELCASALREAARGLENRMASQGFQVLIENTAGQGEQIGRTFEEVEAIISLIPDLDLGMCLDTAHSFAAGYDWRDEQAAKRAFSKLGRTVGFDRVKAVHFNDSKSRFGSRVDRHWHIGHGEIGGTGLARVLNHNKLRNVAFILETPQDTPEADLQNLSAARALIKTLPGSAGL